MLGGFSVESIARQAANGSRKDASEGADSRETARGSILKGGEGLILLQALREMLSALSTNVVVKQAANENRIDASEGADGRDRGMGRRT